MPAPTARKQNEALENLRKDVPAPDVDMSDVIINVQTTLPLETDAHDEKKELVVDAEGNSVFSSEKNHVEGVKKELRKVPVPPHRFTPLKQNWTKIYYPLVDHLKLQVKMQPKRGGGGTVLLRTCKQTTDRSAIQKGYDFLRAFMLGFDIDDATALLRLDDLYMESFEVKDVKTLQGDHLSRAIGRIAGKDGKTKFAIENASRTRVVIADSKIHILGGFTNIKIARETIVSLILGQPPGKIYGNLRIISSRMKERF